MKRKIAESGLNTCYCSQVITQTVQIEVINSGAILCNNWQLFDSLIEFISDPDSISAFMNYLDKRSKNYTWEFQHVAR